MYVPRDFREEDLDRLRASMGDLAAATVVSPGPDGLLASHVPVEVLAEPLPLGRLRCHFARANPHARVLRDGEEALFLFQGPQGYVSPSWYPSKETNQGQVVPTWNYLAIHVYGTVTLFEGAARLRPHLEALTERHEAGRPEPWAMDDAPAEFIDRLCGAIVGIEIAITRIEGKRKMSQNRPREDRDGVAAGFAAVGREDLLREME